jgi:hypothetical protein
MEKSKSLYNEKRGKRKWRGSNERRCVLQGGTERLQALKVLREFLHVPLEKIC